jgi:hypothetical protein
MTCHIYNSPLDLGVPTFQAGPNELSKTYRFGSWVKRVAPANFDACIKRNGQWSKNTMSFYSISYLSTILCYNQNPNFDIVTYLGSVQKHYVIPLVMNRLRTGFPVHWMMIILNVWRVVNSPKKKNINQPSFINDIPWCLMVETY